MLLGSVQINGEKLSSTEVKDISESLHNHSLRLLSIRGCPITQKDFGRLMAALAECKSILQLNLNLGVVSNIERVEMIAKALYKNRSLTTLFVHGSKLKHHGAGVLCQALASHPNIVSLDLGDCSLTDSSVKLLTALFPSNGAKPGLKELTLSANPGISVVGWAQFFMAVASECKLRKLYLDYNQLGDYGAGCLAVALAANKTLELIDLEGTGISEQGGQSILRLHLSAIKIPGLRLLKLLFYQNTCLQSRPSSMLSLQHSRVDIPWPELGSASEAIKIQCRQICEVMLLHLVNTYDLKLKQIVLDGNEIKTATMAEIQLCLGTESSSESETEGYQPQGKRVTVPLPTKRLPAMEKRRESFSKSFSSSSESEDSEADKKKKMEKGPGKKLATVETAAGPQSSSGTDSYTGSSNGEDEEEEETEVKAGPSTAQPILRQKRTTQLTAKERKEKHMSETSQAVRSAYEQVLLSPSSESDRNVENGYFEEASSKNK